METLTYYCDGNKLKSSEHIHVDEAVKGISEKYGYSIYDITVAFDYHIRQNNMFLSIYHGKVAIVRSMTAGEGEWKWKFNQDTAQEVVEPNP